MAVKKKENEVAEEIVVETFDLDKKVTVASLAPWILSFRGVTEAKDVFIPAYSTVLLSRNEIINQVNSGNKLFSGIDGAGSHASIYILDAATRKELGFDTEFSKQNVLTEDVMKSLFAEKNFEAFKTKYKEAVVTRAEKFHAKTIIENNNLNDFQKIRFAEKYAGFTIGE